MPRLYREAPVNSIWEGSGNIMCLDVLRALGRTSGAAEVLRHELGEAKDARIKAFAERIEKRLAGSDHADESQARALVCDLMLALQGSLLVRHAPSNVSDAFCGSRLDGRGSPVFGLLPRGLDTRGIAERAGPAN
jgi:putative acyl-CoA dehydrogenase